MAVFHVDGGDCARRRNEHNERRQAGRPRRHNGEGTSGLASVPRALMQAAIPVRRPSAVLLSSRLSHATSTSTPSLERLFSRGCSRERLCLHRPSIWPQHPQHHRESPRAASTRFRSTARSLDSPAPRALDVIRAPAGTSDAAGGAHAGLLAPGTVRAPPGRGGSCLAAPLPSADAPVTPGGDAFRAPRPRMRLVACGDCGRTEGFSVCASSVPRPPSRARPSCASLQSPLVPAEL